MTGSGWNPGQRARMTWALLCVALLLATAGVASAAETDTLPTDDTTQGATQELDRAEGQIEESEGDATLDEPASDETAPAPSMTAQPADDGQPYPKLDVPEEGWRYETSYFFMLTCGLEDEPIEKWVRNVAMVGTIPLDVFTLPGAALAGLFGP